MYPWLLHLPPISTYGTLIALGCVAAWLWARRGARGAGIDPSHIDLLMPILLATGLAGAWLFGWLTDALTHEHADGAVLVGSLLLATTAGISYAVLNAIPLGVLGDLCAAPLALGIAIGRVGCFFAGCCYGKVSTGTTWLTAVHFPPGSFPFLHQVASGTLPAGGTQSLPVYPVQLYESLGCGLLALLIGFLPRINRRGVTGEQFLAMGLGYALIRFGLEFIRADNPPVGGFTFSQWNAILITVLASATWILRRRYAGKLHLRRPGDRAADAVSFSP